MNLAPKGVRETKLVKSRVNSRFSKFLSLVLSLSLFPIIVISSTLTEPASAANVACSGTMAKQNNYLAAPSHGQVFYIDSGVSPRVDASYVGYNIGNYTGSAVTNLWVSVTNFTGGIVSLANQKDQYQEITSIANNDSSTVFFLLKASNSTTADQTHTVKVWNMRPDLNGASTLLTCDFTFTDVKETIKASANKITGISSALSPATATLGGTVTLTVTGNTGKVGAGSSPDFDIIWVSPVSNSSWPTQSLRFESVTVTLNCDNPKPNIVLKNILIRKNVATDCFSNNSGAWTGVYVFRIIGPGPSSIATSPVAQLSSGTQIKHSNPNGVALNLNMSGVVGTSFTLTKTAVVSSTPSATSSSITIQYTLTLTTTSTSNVVVDEFVDKPNNSATFIAGSATIVDVNRASATTISDPTYISSESAQNPRPVHFVGPFTLKSTRSAVITYKMTLPCSGTPTSYSNTAYASIGTLILGSSATTMPTVTATTTASGGSSCTAPTPETSSTTISVYAQTQPATWTSSTAVLNGYVNPYGVAGGAVMLFRYDTSSTLSNSTTVSLGTLSGSTLTAESSTITGLTPNTTYYFRIEANSTYGDILSFTTDAIQAAPKVTTDQVSSLTGSTATLNGRINPNLTSVSAISFAWGTSSVLSGATTVTLTTDNGNGSTINLTASGATESPYSTGVTGLVSGTTYYYRISASCTSDATYCPGGTVNGSIVSFIAGAPSVNTDVATTVGSTSATLNGTVNTNSTSSNGFYWYCVASSSCTGTSLSDTSSTTLQSLSSSFNGSVYDTLTGLTPGTTYYYQIGAKTTTSPSKTSLGAIKSFTTLNIVTTSLATGATGSSYSSGVAGEGGSSGYTWSITSGTLPSGLSLNSSDGFITGTPTAAGSSNLTFQLLDNLYGTSTTKSLTLTVTATLTYDGNTSTSGSPPSSQTSGSSVVVSSKNTLAKTNYTFNGWNTLANGRGDTYTVGSTFTLSGAGNQTLYALWTIDTYTVTYNGNGNTGGAVPSNQTKTYGVNLTLASNSGSLSRSGYSFGGWNTQSNGRGDTYTVGAAYTSNTGLNLYALWNANDITITFDSNTATSGSMADLNTKADSATILTPNGFAKSGGYTFLYWTEYANGSGTSYSDGSSYTSLISKTLYAQWTNGTPITITYNSNYGTPSSYQQNAVSNASTILNANTFTRAGYTFTGWSTSSGTHAVVYTDSQTVSAGFSGNTPLYAQWDANTLTVTFYSHGGSAIASGSTITGGTVSDPGNPTYVGHTFNGWFVASSGGSALAFPYTHGQTSSFELHAQWTTDTYTVTYSGNSNDSGTAPSAQTKTYGVDLTLATNSGSLTRTGYTFVGWNTLDTGLGTTYDTETTYSTNAPLSLFAKWTAITYSVTYSGNGNTGGSAPGNQTKTYGVNLTLSTNSGSLTKTGYTFVGWNTLDSGLGTTYDTGTTYSLNSALSLFAKWTADTLTVTFNTQGGDPIANGTTVTGGSVSDPGTPTYAGHSFNGWFVASSGGAAISYPYTHGQTSNFTLYAQWAGDTVTVTYNGNSNDGGSVPANQTKTYGVNLTLASNTGTLSRSGYAFGGWNTQSNGNGTPYTEGGTYSANSAVTLYAKWTANDITITFDSNTATSGTMSALTTKADSATVLTSNGFTKSGYSFQYWTEDSGGSGTQYTDASSYSSLTSKTLYAQWTASVTTYTITYDTTTATSGSTTYVTQTYTVGGATLTLNPQGTLARTGYTFGGWKNGATTYTASQSGVTLSSSITLEPIWSGVTYTVTYNGNGNSSGAVPSTQSFTYGSGSVTISSNSGDLKKSSYTFSTWNTASGGTGTTYAPGSTYSGAASITLYAVWDQNSKRSQTISLSGGTLPYLTSTTLRGTGYSGTGSISYSLNSGNCSISGDQLTAQASSGTCIVTVTIASDSTYNSASNNATFNLVKANQVINFTQPRNMLVGESRQSLTYSASSGLPVSLSNNSSGICSVYTSGTDPERNGICSITATQGGNANYNPATNVTVTYSISSVVKKQQNLVFNQPSAMLTSDPAQKLFYFSLTTLPIIVTVNTPSICEVRDGSVYPISAGKCSITVSQNGTVEYEPASVNRIFNIVRNQSVAKRQYMLTWSNPAPIYEGTPLTSIQLNAEASVSGTYEYTPTFGVKLPLGTYKLLVLFSPTDLGTYTTQTTSVTLIVRAAVTPLPTPTVTPKASPTPSSSIDPRGNGVITVATTPVTTVLTQISNSGTVSVPTPSPSPSQTLIPTPSSTPTPTLTPAQSPTPSATRTNSPNPNSSNSASPNSSQAARPTPTPTPSRTPEVIKPTPGVTAAPIPTPSIATATPKPSSSAAVVNQGEGISQVTTAGKEVTVVAEEGYSGKTTVTVTVQDSGQSKKVVIPVTVLPLPAKNPTYQLLSLSKTIVHWGQSDNANSYRVVIDGSQVCATQDLSCTLNKAYGQNNKVEIISVGGDNLTSKEPALFDKSQPFLLTVVNFDTAKYSLTTTAKSLLKDVATKVRALGYKDFTIYGFTDIRGGIDNQKLSLDRATSVKNYISSLVPGADFQISSYGPSYPVASNSTVEGLAANRRAEIWVTG